MSLEGQKEFREMGRQGKVLPRSLFKVMLEGKSGAFVSHVERLLEVFEMNSVIKGRFQD